VEHPNAGAAFGAVYSGELCLSNDRMI
jgi:hypothetical protein